MKKVIILLLFLLIIPLYVSAELSTNLNIVTVMNKQTKTLVDSKTYVDTDGNTVVPDDKGYATVKYAYNNYHRIIREEFFDEHDKPVNCIDGYYSKINKYDGWNLISSEYYDVQGKLVNGPDGYARQETTYFKKRHESTWYYDAEGRPVGSHRISEYEIIKLKTCLISDSWYDPDNQLISGPNGYARVEYEYDGTMVSKISYIAADGSLYYMPSEGYAKVITSYNKNKVSARYYYGEKDELIAGPEGYAYVLYTHQKDYDTEMYYNADGSLFFTDEGICGVEIHSLGNNQTDKYFFVDENLKGKCNEGYYKTRIFTTVQGLIKTQIYYDANDQFMIVDSLGFAKVKYTYKLNTIESEEYYGTDGKLIRSNEGYAVLHNTVTKAGITKTEYFDVDGKTRVSGPEGYAQVEYQIENKNIMITIAFFAAIALIDSINLLSMGIAKTRIKYAEKYQKVLDVTGISNLIYVAVSIAEPTPAIRSIIVMCHKT